jgi:outer membrane receptor for ferrienterochelin and colicin
MHRERLVLPGTAVLLLLAAAAHGEPGLDASEPDLYLKQETTVASVLPATARESPGVLTLLSREEILASGARDLLDVLQLVPGFAPGVDVEGVTDVGFRGVWGHEGKILLLLDGQEMNETLYSTLQLGHELPADQIQSIEIIRGPGSARYGSNAELAVINVKTRGAQDLKGVSASAVYGQTSHGYGHRGVSLAAGQSFEGGLSASISGYFGQGNRSDRNYDDLFGNQAAMTGGNSRLEPAYLNAAAEYKGLRARAIYHRLALNNVDGFGDASPLQSLEFISFLGELAYDWKLSDTLRITPEIHYKRQLPWRDADKSSWLYYDKTAERITGRVTAAWDATPELNLVTGIDAYIDRAWLNDLELTGAQTLFGTSDSVAYQDVAAFSEASWRMPLGNLLAGARFEHHSLVGNAFVPRLALTKVLDPVHFKLLYSQAFRAPGIENISLSSGTLTPERTTVVEAEVGMRFLDGMFATVNAYDLTIRDPIVYGVDASTGQQAYMNAGRTGSRGVEAELRADGRHGFAAVSYAMYTTAGKNEVDLLRGPSPSRVLGLPTHKVSARASLLLTSRLSLNGALAWFSRRDAALTVDSDGNPVIGALAAAALVDVLVRVHDLGVKGLDLSAGVRNLLDTDFRYAQPFNAGHAPLPGPSREFVVRLAYDAALP